MASQELEHILSATNYIKKQLGEFTPRIGFILGSGLGELAEQVTEAKVFDYANVPYFPMTSVDGHIGKWVAGQFQDQSVIMMQGRFHYYEGYSMKKIVMPIYMMKQLGVEILIVTNAAGGINASFQAGDLMLITDHINLTGDNPLIGKHDEALGVRFPDMSQAYDPRLRKIAHDAAKSLTRSKKHTVSLKEGVYAGITGPAYLTPAELRMIARIGSDAVGMSTVAEVIAARHAGIAVLGISCITDMAIADELEPLTHEQVIAMANQNKPKLIQLLKEIVKRIAVQ